MKEDFYDILGVSKQASETEIKRPIAKRPFNTIQIKIRVIRPQKQILKKRQKPMRY